MQILWNYLKPHRWLVFWSLLLAGASQVLIMIDPLIFGKIIDDYASVPSARPQPELVRGVLYWLGIAIAVALLARAAKSFQEYMMRLVVQKFGMQVFNDGLKQTLRLSFEEYEEQRSGETLAVLQKVRTDTERFINAFINILFTSLVGMGFLVWYAITKHWALIPVFVVGILVLGGLTGLLSKKMKSVQRAINRETLQLSGAITESLRNIELVKSLGLTFPEIRRLKMFTQQIFNLEMQKTRQVRTLSFLQGTTLNLLKQSILFILLWLIFRSILTTGELITMQFITTAIFVPLQFLQSLSNPPLTILVTAYEKYALEGYNLQVADYLLKPFSFERFLKACNRADELLKLRQQPSPAKDFFVNVEYTQVKITVADIEYIEGLKDYIKIHLSSSPKPVLTRMTIKAMEEKLPAGAFIRTHKSYLVAASKITMIKRDLVYIGKTEIPVSESYKENVNRLSNS